MENNQDKLLCLLDDYKDIRIKLEASLNNINKVEAYTDIIALISKVSEFVLQSRPVISEKINSIIYKKTNEL